MSKGLKQTRKVQGSLVNSMYGNNSTVPKTGEWATICMWSDRSVAKVHAVSEDGKRVTLESCSTKADPEAKDIGIGHQSWVHEPTGQYYDLVYRNGAWRRENIGVVFTKEYSEGYDFPANKLTDEQREKIYTSDDGHRECFPQQVVEGITRIKKSFPKISIIFGVCDYHYDWTF